VFARSHSSPASLVAQKDARPALLLKEGLSARRSKNARYPAPRSIIAPLHGGLDDVVSPRESLALDRVQLPPQRDIVGLLASTPPGPSCRQRRNAGDT
jgi:hypothetical protein